jgi:hypothetical protein
MLVEERAGERRLLSLGKGDSPAACFKIPAIGLAGNVASAKREAYHLSPSPEGDGRGEDEPKTPPNQEVLVFPARRVILRLCGA